MPVIPPLLSLSLFLPVCSHCSGLALPADWTKQSLTFTTEERGKEVEMKEEETKSKREKENWKALEQHKSQANAAQCSTLHYFQHLNVVLNTFIALINVC